MADENSLPANTPKKPFVKKVIPICIYILCGILVLFMLVPTLPRERQIARRIACASNMHRIGLTLLTYADDGNGVNRLGPTLDWNALIKKGHLSAEQFSCPYADHPNYMYIRDAGSPATRDAGNAQLKIISSSKVPILFEPLENHDGEGGNILYVDGHVEFCNQTEYDKILAPYKDRAIKVETAGFPLSRE